MMPLTEWNSLVDFDPAVFLTFTCEVSRRYGAVQMSNAVKVFLAFEASFWPEGLFDVVCANCFLPELWILSYPAPALPRSSTKKETIFDPSVAVRTKHVVTFFAAGNLADQLSVMPKDEVVEKALDQLDEMFGSKVRRDSISRCPDVTMFAP